MRWMAMVLGLAVLCIGSNAPCETRLPSCGDRHYSDEQWNAAIARAHANLEKRGTHVTDLDSANVMLLYGEVEKELGCRIPEGEDPASGMRAAPDRRP